MSQLVDILMPSSDQEGTISVIATWLKKVGDTVALHEPLLEINTDKVTIEVPSPVGGVLKEILKKVEDEVNAGEVLGRVEQSDALRSAEGMEELSPAVKKLLKEHKISHTKVQGTGRGGRITHQDVLQYLEKQNQSTTSSFLKKVPHTPMRKRIAEHMVQSALKTAPHVTAVFEADLSRVIAHREEHKEEFQKQGVKLTLSAYFLKAIVEGVKVVPEVNSRFTESELEVYFDVNIGVAVAVKDGLIVPVIPHAQNLDLLGLAKELDRVTTKGRNEDLKAEDLRNATFTMTNHGVSGSLIATPIIHQPQSAILGIGKLEKRAIVKEENGKDVIVSRPMVYVTLTIDHRALDGFQANTFLVKFVETLEKW